MASVADGGPLGVDGPSARVVAIGAAFGELVARVRNVDALARAVVGDRGGKAGVADGVQRMRRDRKQAARQLVDALRAAFEAADPLFDAELDGLVIARLEMQAAHE